MTNRNAPTSTARRYDKNRPWRKLYDTKRWKVLRLQQLARCPLCWMCESRGILTPASVADHVIPHKGDEELFFNGQLASLCPTHHDSSKQKAEKRGVQEIGCETDGVPIDPCHHWNA